MKGYIYFYLKIYYSQLHLFFICVFSLHIDFRLFLYWQPEFSTSFMSQDLQLSDFPSATTPPYKSLPQVCQTPNNINSFQTLQAKKKAHIVWKPFTDIKLRPVAI